VKQCNDIFEDIITANTLEEAEEFFRSVDRYNRLKGPIHKLTSRLQDLYWTFAPPHRSGPTKAVNCQEGGKNLEAPGRVAAAQEVPNVGVNPDGTAKLPIPSKKHQQNGQHDVFICLALGRPGGWKLRHAKFTGRAGEPSKVTDEAMFKQVRAEIGKHQVSRGLIRFLFPLRLSKAEYYEVSRARWI